MKRKLFVFDVDSTLLPLNYEKIPDGTIKAVNTLLEEGHIIAINSGRPFGGIKPFLDAFVDGEKYAIAANGAALYTKDGALIEQETMPISVLHYFKRRFMGEGKDVYAYATNNSLYLYGPRISAWANWEIMANGMPNYTDLNAVSVPIDTKILKVMICGPKEWIPIIPFTKEERDHYHIVITGDEYLEILPKHVDKAEPIHTLCKKLGIDEDDVYCFGDSGNDIGMLSAFHGIAMGESTPAAKEAAQYLTKPSYENGIAYALKEILRVI